MDAITQGALLGFLIGATVSLLLLIAIIVSEAEAAQKRGVIDEAQRIIREDDHGE